MTVPFLLMCATADASSLGVGAALVKDLPDRVEPETEFGVGGALLLPLRVDLAPAAALRTTVRFDASKGRDQVTWSVGEERIGEAPEWAAFVSAAATVGPEVHFRADGPVIPYLSGEVGVALVHTFHDIERPELIPPEHRESPGSLDPYGRQAAFLTDVGLGALVGPGWVELGYTNAFLGDGRLRRAPEELELEHAPYAWNALRLAVGVSIPLD